MICSLRSPVARKISLAQETFFSESHPRSDYLLFPTIHRYLILNTLSLQNQSTICTVSFLSVIGWNANNYNWIFIFNDISSHGACACLFSRTEYQQTSDNFPHKHTILALKKDTLDSRTNDQLNKLISTNVMEIIKHDQIEKLMEDSLLTCIEDINDIFQDGWRKLKHNCNKRCLIKIGDGDGSENYRCRKQHSVKGTPDLTSHQLSKSHVFYWIP